MRKVVHHIVYSTKGGCGKTAFSLCLSCTELSEFIRKVSGKEGASYTTDTQTTTSLLNYNYYLDLDFLGTSVMECLPIFESEVAKVQDLIFNRLTVDNIKKIVDNKLDLKVFAVPADKEQKEKNNFQVKRKHTPLLRYDEFRYEMDSIISNIGLFVDTESLNNNNYSINYIYDLPPNSDGYTEAFFEEIFKKLTVNSSDKIILYILFNNRAMLNCNIEWLTYFMSEDKNRRCNVIFVYTENLKTIEKYDLNTVKSMMDDKIKNRDFKLSFYTFKHDDKISSLYNEQESYDSEKFEALKLNIADEVIVED